MKVWWLVYNKQLFEGKLPTPVFLIKAFAHCGEYHNGTITLSSNITTTEAAKATLVHEMVHQWQDLNGFPLDHKGRFQEWAAMILVNTNMEI